MLTQAKNLEQLRIRIALESDRFDPNDNSRQASKKTTKYFLPRLTASAVCFQLGLGYGEATLIELNNTINTTWSHPINTKDDPLPLIWLDEAKLEDQWAAASVNPQGYGLFDNLGFVVNFLPV